MELGIPGLLILSDIFAWIIGRTFHQRRLIDDPAIRAVAGSFIAFVVWVSIYMTKGPVIDLDPINVYFWLYVGILFGLPNLIVAEGRSAADPGWHRASMNWDRPASPQAANFDLDQRNA